MDALAIPSGNMVSGPHNPHCKIATITGDENDNWATPIFSGMGSQWHV